MVLNPVRVKIQGSSKTVMKSRVVNQIFTYMANGYFTMANGHFTMAKWPLIFMADGHNE